MRKRIPFCRNSNEFVSLSFISNKIICDFVEKNGAEWWQRIVPLIGGRPARQCRERWKNYLCPFVEHNPWTEEEDLLLEKLVEENGKQWSKIVSHFETRTDVIIKNRYALLKRHMKSGKRIVSRIQEKVKPVVESLKAPSRLMRSQFEFDESLFDSLSVFDGYDTFQDSNLDLMRE